MTQLAVVLALFVALTPRANSEQERFARDVLADLALGRDDWVATRVRAEPARAFTLVHTLLIQAAEPGTDVARTLDAARRLAAAHVDGTLREAVLRFEALDATGRERVARHEGAYALAHAHAANGRLDDARRAAYEALTLASGNPFLEARAHRILARVLCDRARSGDSLDHASHALALDLALGADLEAMEDRRLLAERRVDLALAACAESRYGAAIADLERAAALFDAGREPLRASHARLQLAGVESEVGLVGDAAATLERALAALDGERDPLERGQALVLRGLVRLDDGRPAEALAPLDEGERLLERAGDAHGRSQAVQHRATALLVLGRAPDAEAAYRDARRLRAANNDTFGEALSATGIGDALEHRGRLDDARAAFEEALAIAAPLGNPEAAWRARAGLGRVADKQGRDADALAALLAAIDDIEAIRGHVTGMTARSLYLGDKLDAHRRAALLLARAGRFGEAFRAAEATKARTLLEIGTPEPRAGAPSLEDVRRALTRDQAIVEYVVGAERSGAFIVRRDAVRFVEIDASESAIAERVSRIFRPIEALRAGRTDLANLGFDAASAKWLHERLVRPLNDALDECTELWVVPDGPLRRLPFGLLVTRRKQLPVDPERLHAHLEGLRFLVEDVAVGHLPAAGLVARRHRSEGEPTRGLLAVADPRPTPAGSPSLRAAIAEARDVARRFGASDSVLLLGADASEARFKEDAPRASRLHLAVHGVLDDRRPGDSRLDLSPGAGEDGRLHAHEVERLRLRAECVFLSACETAGTAGRGEGLFGLSRAFLLAGARSVVATAWLVDDGATARLAQGFDVALARGISTVQALRAAQVDVLRSSRGGVSPFVHPFFWGGFVLLGTP